MTEETAAGQGTVGSPDERPVRPLYCQGNCDPHDGEHRLVHVTDKRMGKDWGLFWYCDEAVRTDKFRGLHVEDA